MLSLRSVGLALILTGLLLVVLDVFSRHRAFGWLGKLPGDIYVDTQGFKFFAPLGTMVVLSVILNVCLWVVRKLF